MKSSENVGIKSENGVWQNGERQFKSKCDDPRQAFCLNPAILCIFPD